MQGRAGKAPKREMVIESPQQYKSLAEIEAELEAGAQVAAVSERHLSRTEAEVFSRNTPPLSSGSRTLEGAAIDLIV